jgi:hypothetical protein
VGPAAGGAMIAMSGKTDRYGPTDGATVRLQTLCLGRRRVFVSSTSAVEVGTMDRAPLVAV